MGGCPVMFQGFRRVAKSAITGWYPKTTRGRRVARRPGRKIRLCHILDFLRGTKTQLPMQVSWTDTEAIFAA